MGYNSVAIILNDATGSIAEDPKFGGRVADAIRGFAGRPYGQPFAGEASAVTANGCGVFSGALKIIGQEHADFYQTVVVGRNSGWSLADDAVPEHVLEAVAKALRRRGYRVTKPKPQAGD